MEQLIEFISKIIASSGIFAPLFAFFAGILVSFTPCSLSSIPLIVGYVGLSENKGYKTFIFSKRCVCPWNSLYFYCFGSCFCFNREHTFSFR